jgi:GntR family transcriptional regulator, transcriptional repressor for pyruvate dehydrogenase complex
MPGHAAGSVRNLLSAGNAGRRDDRLLGLSGTLEVRHGDGIYLKSLPNESGHLMELMTQRHRLPAILEAREALETQLAALAAARRTEEDLAEMTRALDVMAADIEADGFGEGGDRLFHEAVTRAARSPLLADFMAGLAVPISETRHSSLGEPGRPPRSLRAHHRILEAIRRGAPRFARVALLGLGRPWRAGPVRAG